MEYGKNALGLDLRLGSIREASQAGLHCDLLILSHVVEHFGDLDQSLRDLHALLHPESLVYIAVPSLWDIGTPTNCDPLQWFRLAHVWSFCGETLRCVMDRCGYDPVCTDERYTLRSLWRRRTEARPSYQLVPDPTLVPRILNHLQESERRRRLLAPRLWLKTNAPYIVRKMARRLGVYGPTRRIYRTMRSR
jgi:hypothetical protein